MVEYIPLVLFLVVCILLILGYPVAFTLGGVAILSAVIGAICGTFDLSLLGFVPNRLFGIITNQTLVAVPLFVLMGVTLERSKVASNLLSSMESLLGNRSGGLAISVTLVGALLAASTGIVGAVVVTLGLLSLPSMIKRGYHPSVATGVLCATGTLGQIIPPSIALVLLGDVLSSAYQQAQLNMGKFSLSTVSVGDLFLGALIPGLILVVFYLAYLLMIAYLKPEWVPAAPETSHVSTRKRYFSEMIKSLYGPLFLIFLVLGSIFAGLATPTEAAAIGALGSLLLACIQKQINFPKLLEIGRETLTVTSMVFLILIGANLFSLVFRGYGGDELIQSGFESLPGGVVAATLIVMLVIFFLGFILDFIEITFVVIPIVGPVLLTMGLDPVWLGVMIALNLQTSFLTPPFGFALFYLRGVAPSSIKTGQIYTGVAPFILIQILVMALVAIFPQLATDLPKIVYNN